MTPTPGEERVQWAEQIGEWLVKWQRQDASVYDLADTFLTHLREAEGCTGMSGCSHTVEHRLCVFCLDFKLAQNGAAWQKELAQAEQQRDNWRNDFQEACRQRDQAEQRVARLETALELAYRIDEGDESLCRQCANPWGGTHDAECFVGAALTPPPPAQPPEYLRTTLHGVKVKVLLDDEQK